MAFNKIIIISNYRRGGSGEIKLIILTCASGFIMQGYVKAVD